MKGLPFAIVILLGLYVFVSAFSRGAEVELPAELKPRPVVYRPNGYPLRLDGYAIKDPWEGELTANLTPIVNRDGLPVAIGAINGRKLTQGSVLLLRVGHPIARYREAFPTAPVRGGFWPVNSDLELNVQGEEYVYAIQLRYRRRAVEPDRRHKQPQAYPYPWPR